MTPPVQQKSAGVPIIRLGDILLTGLLDDLDDKTALLFTEELIERIAADRARGVVIDISRLEIIDSFVARVLTELAGSVGCWVRRSSSRACGPPSPSRSAASAWG